jgi:hypothetical protein
MAQCVQLHQGQPFISIRKARMERGQFDVVSPKTSDGGALSNRGSLMQPTIVQAFLAVM